MAEAEATKTKLVKIAGISRRTLSKILNEGHVPSPRIRGKIVHAIDKLLREARGKSARHIRYPTEKKTGGERAADETATGDAFGLLGVERALLLSGSMLERSVAWLPFFETLTPADSPTGPYPANVEPRTVYPVHVSWTGGDAQAFILPVKGNELMGLSIHEGDLVVVAPNLEVKSGELAALLWKGSLVMRRVIRRQMEVILEASHPNFEPISVPAGEPLRIVGRITCVVRTMKK